MDLTGSLIDTQLKIYPLQKYAFLLKTLISTDEEAPDNVKHFLKNGDYEETTINPSNHNEQQNDFALDVHDLSNLENIKTIVEKIESINSENSKNNDKSVSDKIENCHIPGNPQKKSYSKKYLTTPDICWLYKKLKDERKSNKNIPYLHELLESAYIELPKNEIIKRNPDLEARCVKLRAQQEEREYRQMTKCVDPIRKKYPEDTIQYQLKEINRQLVAIGQFIISICAGFFFGLKGVEWMIGDLDFGFRLLLGVMCALVIALAEIYFLAKRLNEELNVLDSIKQHDLQKQSNTSETQELRKKEHQD